MATSNSLLIVDDDTSNLRMLIHILQEDYTIYTAKNGEEALNKAAISLPDLILLDIILPNIDGYEVLARLRESDDTKEIPVIFITGLSESSSEEKGLQLGAVDYVTKPFNPAVVRIKVRHQIQIINLQRALAGAAEAARIANHAKSAFLAKMSHEIRTPMNAILGITALQLQDETLTPDMREVFGMIYNSGDMLLGILNDILDMSKIEAGRLELVPAAYGVASLINDVTQLNIMRIDNKPVEFELHVDANTPAVVVGDALRMKQILNNLLSNAFKYTAQGVVKLSLSLETEEGDGRLRHEAPTLESGENAPDVTFVFIVSDTGQGMTAEQLSRLFDEYSRFNLEVNRAIEGAGLGMTITRNLIHMMHGDILVESEPNRGSTITVRLPQRNAGDEVLGQEVVDQLRQFNKRGTAQMRRTQIIREPMPYGSVLVVDDVATNLYVAKGLLASYGLTVDTAERGAAAIEKIKQGKVYDIVFMDHIMPGMDGMEATGAIRALGYTRPVIALTADAMVGRAGIFRARGFDDFIAKPIDLREMNAVLNKFIRDVYPPEVVEAARRQKSGADPQRVDATPQAADPNLTKIFLQDASKALAVLETLCEKQGAFSDEDMRTYVINIHSMKSALANIGELDLSALAAGLERAGRKRDAAVIASKIPDFLNALRELIKKITSRETGERNAATDADLPYLRESLLAIKTACVAYNRKAAKDKLSEIRQKAWPRPTEARLDAIAEHLLHSKFKAIIAIINVVDEMLEEASGG